MADILVPPGGDVFATTRYRQEKDLIVVTVKMVDVNGDELEKFVHRFVAAEVLTPPTPEPTPEPEPTSIPEPPPSGDKPVSAIIGPLTLASTVPTIPTDLQAWQRKLEVEGDIRWAHDGNEFQSTIQYDRALGWYTHWARTGDAKWLNRATHQAIAWREFFRRDDYSYQPQNDALTGVAIHAALTGDAESLRCVRMVAEAFDAIWVSSLNDIDATYTDGRIQSRVLLSAIRAHQLGFDGWAAKAAIDLEKILSTQQDNGSFISKVNCYGSLNFMTGMLLESFIQYDNVFPGNVDILAAVQRAMAHLWNTQWTGSAFKYFSKNACWGQTGLQAAQSDLNAYFLLPCYWLFAKTGDTVWRDRGDAIIAGTVHDAWWGQASAGNGAKQYNQQIATVGQALSWRAQ